MTRASRTFLTLIACAAIVSVPGSAVAKDGFKKCQDIDELAVKISVSGIGCARGHKTIIDAYQGEQAPFICAKKGQRARCKYGDKIVKWSYP